MLLSLFYPVSLPLQHLLLSLLFSVSVSIPIEAGMQMQAIYPNPYRQHNAPRARLPQQAWISMTPVIQTHEQQSWTSVCITLTSNQVPSVNTCKIAPLMKHFHNFHYSCHSFAIDRWQGGHNKQESELLPTSASHMQPMQTSLSNILLLFF